MPDLSDTVAKCRIGTAKNFTLLLLLYHTQIKTNGMKQLYNFLENKGYLLETVEKQKRQSLQAKDIVLFVKLDLKKNMYHPEVISELNKLDAVHYLEEIK